MPRPFLTAEWRKIVMAQYELPPSALEPFLPPGLQLDLYRDAADPAAPPRCFVSLVGFLFDNVRILGARIPLHTRFPEINLRFYVTRTLPDGTLRRGVVFLSEIVPRRAITAVARTLYGEPYSTRPMRFRIALNPDHLGVSYQFDFRKVAQTIAVTASPNPTPLAAGSLDHFIAEHYFGYTHRRHHRTRSSDQPNCTSPTHTSAQPTSAAQTAKSGGRTSEYEVQHPRWLHYPILRHYIRVDFASIYGPAFAHLTPASPDHILLAEGSAITVLPGHRL